MNMEEMEDESKEEIVEKGSKNEEIIKEENESASTYETGEEKPNDPQIPSIDEEGKLEGNEEDNKSEEERAIHDINEEEAKDEVVVVRESVSTQDYPNMNTGSDSGSLGLDPEEIFNFWRESKENYIKLVEWEDGRLTKGRANHSLIQTLCSRILYLLEKTAVHNQIIQNYFGIQCSNIKEYLKIISKPNPINLENLFPFYSKYNSKLNDILIHGRDFEHDFKLRIESFVKFIDTLLMKDLKNLALQYAKSIKAFKEVKEKMEKKIKTTEHIAEMMYEGHSNTITQKENYIKKGNAVDKDIWLSERRFKIAANEHSKAQIHYGEFLFSMWEDVKRMEVKRVQTMKKGFEQYYFKHKTTFGLQESTEKTLLDIAGLEIQNSGEDLYSATHLFDNSEFKELEKQAKTKGIGNTLIFNAESLKRMSPSTFREFLHSLFEKYTEVPITNLEVKKGKLKRASGLFQTWANCYVVITRDSYCHIFDSEADIQPLFTFDLLKTQAKGIPSQKNTEQVIELLENKPKGVFKLGAGKKIRLQTENNKDMSEWLLCFHPKKPHKKGSSSMVAE